MKIFYGVQGTGNGHISRARMMAKELFDADFEVTFQFTGRQADKFFDMEMFNGYKHCQGMTFNINKGKVNYLKTALQAKPIQFMQDVKALDLSDYDLVISDFEPVTSWAARRQKKTVLGIGHQYAFDYNIPRVGSDPVADWVMKNFAPADIGIGLHWHHFNQPILPPIIATPEFPDTVQRNKIIVYLPFEDQHDVIEYFSPFKDFQFILYSPDPVASRYDHVCCKPLSREGFQQDLYDCAGMISNAGFELPSEALQLGKKILVKPVHAQMEQISNAAALEQLGYGQIMHNINAGIIESWLYQDKALHISYPNIAAVIVQWIKDGMPKMDADFIEKVWGQIEVKELFSPAE